MGFATLRAEYAGQAECAEQAEHAEHDRRPVPVPGPRAGARPLLAVPAAPASVPVLRRFAEDAAGRWGVPVEATERLALAVTELVTQAVLHSHGPEVAVAVGFDGAVLDVEVTASGAWLWWGRWAACRVADQDAVSGGWGLGLVRHCVTSCVAFPSPAGTRVLARLAVGPATP